MGFNLSHIKLQKRLVCLLVNSFCQTSVVHGCVSLWSPSGLKAKKFAFAATWLNVFPVNPLSRILNSDANEHCNFNCTTFKLKNKSLKNSFFCEEFYFLRVWCFFVYITLSLALCKYFDRKKRSKHPHTAQHTQEYNFPLDAQIQAAFP